MDFALARYNPDGSLDGTFGTGGKVTTDFGGSADVARADTIQLNGKILAAGRSGFDDFALARYDPDGSLDTTFGTGGKVTTDIAGSFEEATAIALQSDGRIVVGGGAIVQGIFAFALARYLGDPTLLTVSIDVKPMSMNNPVNLTSRGLIPVAVLTTDRFDATTVDPATACFGDAEDPSQRDCTETHGQGHRSDVNGDGRADLVLHYAISQTGIDPGDTTACLTGRTTTGIDIEGCDSIKTL